MSVQRKLGEKIPSLPPVLSSLPIAELFTASIVTTCLYLLRRYFSLDMRVDAANPKEKTKTFQAYLPANERVYSCAHCRANLAIHDQLISKSFQGSQGKAYLFNSVVNIGCGPSEERVLLTGQHTVADIFCDCCKTTLGWKYEYAYEMSQKYKEGKYIIELVHMVKDNGWRQEDRRKRRSIF